MIKQGMTGLCRSTVPIPTLLEISRLHAKIEGCRQKVPLHVQENLMRTFGGDLNPLEIQDLARRFINFYKFKDLVAKLPFHLRFAKSQCWSIQGGEYLDTILKDGRGAIVVFRHFGLDRMIGPILDASGYKTLTITGGREGRRIRITRRLAGKSKMHPLFALIHPADYARVGLDIRPILNALRSNTVVLIAGDGLVATEFEEFEFLGEEYPYPTGPWKISASTGAAVLLISTEEGDPGQICKLVISPALKMNSIADVRPGMEKYARGYDREAQAAPYLWHRWNIANVFENAKEYSRSEERFTLGFSSWASSL